MHSLAQRVLSHVRRHELLKAGDRVGVAVSGGIDSVALLRLMLELRGELGIVLSVVHFNHKLRGAESDADEQFVANLAREQDLEFHVDSDDVAEVAAEERVGVEAAAREVRYGFFRHLIQEKRSEQAGTKIPTSRKSAETWGTPGGFSSNQRRGILDKIVTGHTLDDQAETVLMRMIRGAGLRGLGGIYPRIAVEDDEGEVSGEIVRPLLGVRRRELQQYLRDIGQTWREDSTNADGSLTRNRVRHLVVPLLEREFNPAVAENLAELAEIARGEEDFWENEVAGWMGTVVHWSVPDWARAAVEQPSLVQIAATETSLQSCIADAPWPVMNATVDLLWFLGEPRAVQRRLVTAIGAHAGFPLEFKHVEEILRFAAEHATGKELSLPLGWKLVCNPDELVFLTPDLRGKTPSPDYEYDLPSSGHVSVYEIRSTFEIRGIPAKEVTDTSVDQLLDAESLAGPLKVRNWRPGDRFWPAHTKSPKKIKGLLQDRHVPQAERRLWPVVVSGEEIVWLRGFPAPAKFQAKTGRAAVQINEIPFSR